MKILVTGGTGFIGSHLVEALAAKGREVRCLVRRNSDIKHLEKLNVEIVYGDLVDKSSLKEAVEGVDIIYHLAAILSYKHEPREKYELVNLHGTKNLLDLCAKKEIQRFIYFSSIGVVGPTNAPILLNEKTPCRPISPYGISKNKAERLVLEYFTKYRLPVVVIRPSKVYGPGDMSELLKLYQLIQKKLFRFVGDMKNRKRSFCFIDNLTEVSLVAEEKECSVGEIYFIADERPYTLEEFVGAVAKAENVKLPKINIPLWIGKLAVFSFTALSKISCLHPIFSWDALKRAVAENEICDISKAKRELNYAPKFSLKEAMPPTINWYREKGLLT